MIPEIATYLRENGKREWGNDPFPRRNTLQAIADFLRSKHKYGYANRLEDHYR